MRLIRRYAAQLLALAIVAAACTTGDVESREQSGCNTDEPEPVPSDSPAVDAGLPFRICEPDEPLDECVCWCLPGGDDGCPTLESDRPKPKLTSQHEPATQASNIQVAQTGDGTIDMPSPFLCCNRISNPYTENHDEHKNHQPHPLPPHQHPRPRGARDRGRAPRSLLHLGGVPIRAPPGAHQLQNPGAVAPILGPATRPAPHSTPRHETGEQIMQTTLVIGTNHDRGARPIVLRRVRSDVKRAADLMRDTGYASVRVGCDGELRSDWGNAMRCPACFVGRPHTAAEHAELVAGAEVGR